MRWIFATLMMLAFDVSADVVVRDNAEQTVVRYDRSYALLIGVSDYTAGWRDLPSIPAELAQVESVLGEHGFEITKVLDPTEDDLRQAFEHFIDAHGYGESHRLLVYFAGHGYSRELAVGLRGYLVPADAPRPTEDLDGFLGKAVPMVDVEAWARRIEAKHGLFVFDSCFSGTVFDSRGELAQPASITAKMGRSVRQFLTAGSAGEEVPGKSVFTPALVRGLHGEADLVRDGYVTGTELGVYLDQRVRYPGQTPQFGRLRGYHEGDFVFRLDPEAAAPVDRLSWIPFDLVETALKGPETREGRKGGEIWIEPAVGMKFRYIPAGSFHMGSPDHELGRYDNETRHEVTLSRGFWMGETEVTREQWRTVMSNNPSHFLSCGDACPVETVNWFEAIAYANALSNIAGYTACYRVSGQNGERAGEGLEFESVEWERDCTGFRLPSEAEWERASRAGSSSALYSGELTISGERNGPELDQIAWYGGNSGVSYSIGSPCWDWKERQVPSLRTCGPHPVAEKKPNQWGLHDTLGNVWEWTWDWYGSYREELQVDPIGPAGGAGRILRGGSWNAVARHVRAAYRSWHIPGVRRAYFGFRLTRSQKAESEESR